MRVQIDNECKKYYSSKIEVNNLIEQKLNDNIEITLVDDPESYLLDLNMYIPNFLTLLWEQPKIVSLLLLNSDNKNVKEVLAPLFCNNFYQNILSPYTVEENLLYIISFLLIDEIGKLNSIDQVTNFLNQTPCGYLLSELKNKSDILTFSKTVIQKVLEKIEVTCSEKKLNINILNLINEIKSIESDLKKKNKNLSNIEDIIFLSNTDNSMSGEDDKNDKKNSCFEIYLNNNKKTSELFNSKYITNLNKKELEKIFDNYKEQGNMNEYINKFINECNNDPDLFSNEKFKNQIFNETYSNLLITFYRIDFLKLIDLLDLLIESFLSSIQLLPYSIKCICKLISVLVKNKFPEIKKVQENAFIAQFLFVTLFIPLFKNPIKVFINDFIISSHAVSNLGVLLEIFNQLILGRLFTNKEGEYNYTPFNWYFIEKMPKIFNFFEQIIKVDLPKFVEKLIKEELPKDYEYEYFKENPEEIISHRSICFSLNDINCIIDNMNQCKNILFPEMNNSINNNINNINNEKNNIDNSINNNNNNIDNNDKNNITKEQRLFKIFTKLNSEYYKKVINNIIKINEKGKKKSKNKKENLILLSSLLINPQYDNLFNLEQKKAYFYIKELSRIENDEEYIKNNIIRVKNYLCGLLYNCTKLNKFDFSSTNNTIEILKEIKLFLKTNEFIIDNSIPYGWYVDSLLECLKKIPVELAENDYEKLYEELEKNINKSIELLDFYMMSDCFGKIKYTRKGIEFYNKIKNLQKEINLNEKLKDIIENDYIKFVMEFKFSNRDKLFSIKEYDKIDDKQNEMVREVSNNRRICANISQFLSYFPNFVKLESEKGIDILKELEELEIPKKLNDYLSSIYKSLNKEKKISKEELDIIKEKIFNHVMNKLYDKIYPKKQSEIDKIIYNNCIKLSWIEAKHFIANEKNSNYDIFIDDLKQSFILLDMEKSPKKKYQVVLEIFKKIYQIQQFNDEEDLSADDNIKILAYIFVRIQPKRIHTNIKFMKLFINIGEDDFQLTYLATACKILQDINYKHLIDIDENEFNQNCQKVLDEINNKKDNENIAINNVNTDN